jgi:hypothetical protein
MQASTVEFLPRNQIDDEVSGCSADVLLRQCNLAWQITVLLCKPVKP